MIKHTEEFMREAVRIALTNDLGAEEHITGFYKFGSRISWETPER